MKLREDASKEWLRAHGLPIPDGLVASTPDQVTKAARELGGHVVVKALVPAGRRGKAGGVKVVHNAEAARKAAEAIFGMDIAGHRVMQVYVESTVAIASEYYLSFGFGALAPRVAVSREGGVDIEEVGDRIVSSEINPLRSLTRWHAASLWDRAGVESTLIPSLADVTVRLYQAFGDADALLLELNPLAVTAEGAVSIVGAMMEIDSNALFRHGAWQDLERYEVGLDGRPPNEREQSVLTADRKFTGGAIRYIELSGDIALFVAGGGAGLLQHDLVLAAGGRPANHSDFSPAGIDKSAALFDAIFTNPQAKGLLVGMNYLQLLPCTVIINALLMSIARNGVDPRCFPIVVRVFGPDEDEARRICASIAGIQYLSHGATLEDGVRQIVHAVEQRR